MYRLAAAAAGCRSACVYPDYKKKKEKKRNL